MHLLNRSLVSTSLASMGLASLLMAFAPAQTSEQTPAKNNRTGTTQLSSPAAKTKRAPIKTSGAAAKKASPVQVKEASAQKANKLPTMVRTTSKAVVRNYQDRSGSPVMDVKEGTLLQVYSVSQGAYPFYEVSVAQGLPVWVFGQYLEKTTVDGVLRVNGNHVNQRPNPSTDVGSMPLSTRLMATDRVLFIKRQNPGISWDNDWIQIYAPTRTRGWVEAIYTDPVKDLGAAQEEWKGSLRVIPKGNGQSGPRPAEATQPTKAQASNEKVRPEAIRSLRYSDNLFRQAIANKETSLEQWQSVENAYHKVLEMAPAGTTTRELAMQQLEKLKMHKSVASMKVQIANEETQKTERLAELVEAQRIEDLKRTTTWGRFHARGWVEKETIAGEPRYFVRWDGGRQAELACGSGRYDLSFYEGFQVGVQGSTRRVAAPATLEADAVLRMVDVARIEVIAGSASLR